MKRNTLFVFVILMVVFCVHGVYAQETCNCDELLRRIEALEAAIFGNTTQDVTLPVVNSMNTEAKKIQEADGHVVSLLDYSLTGDKIVAIFRVDNNTGNDLTLSTLLDWEAKDNTGKKLDLDWLGSDLDTTLVPGDFIKGTISFTGVTEMPVRYQYSTGLWGGTTLMFIVGE